MYSFDSSKEDDFGSQASESSPQPGLHLHDESNGGEFLDDGIRMTELPFKSGNESNDDTFTANFQPD